jgi:hypothetical protein
MKEITTTWPLNYFVYHKNDHYKTISGFKGDVLSKIIADIVSDPDMSLYDELSEYAQDAFLEYLEYTLSTTFRYGAGPEQLPFVIPYAGDPKDRHRFADYVILGATLELYLPALLEKLYNIGASDLELNQKDIDALMLDFKKRGPIFIKTIRKVPFPYGQK